MRGETEKKTKYLAPQVSEELFFVLRRRAQRRGGAGHGAAGQAGEGRSNLWHNGVGSHFAFVGAVRGIDGNVGQALHDAVARLGDEDGGSTFAVEGLLDETERTGFG